MTSPNEDIIRRSMAIYNETGEPAWSLIDPEITFRTRGDVDAPATYRGVDGFRQALSAFGTVWSEIRWELRELVGEGDIFVARIGFQLRGASSGVEVEVEEAWAIWMRGGRFLRIEQYGDWAGALEAAGRS